jgi:hypothetical protein
MLEAPDPVSAKVEAHVPAVCFPTGSQWGGWTEISLQVATNWRLAYRDVFFLS